MAYAIAYDAAGGGTVMVPRRVKPYQELGVASGAERRVPKLKPLSRDAQIKTVDKIG